MAAARADVITWSAADAGIADLEMRPAWFADRRQARFAPPPRSERRRSSKCRDVALSESADALIEAIFVREPKIEQDLLKPHPASGGDKRHDQHASTAQGGGRASMKKNCRSTSSSTSTCGSSSRWSAARFILSRGN